MTPSELTDGELDLPSQITVARANSARKAGRFPWRTEKVIEHAVTACLLLGAVAIVKAGMMDRARDAVLCLGGALGACTLVCYLYFQRD